MAKRNERCISPLVQLEELAEYQKKLTAALEGEIIGQKSVLEELLLALFCEGHVLLTGVPGLAKTLMVRTLAGLLDLSFSRIQFTPDLMPSDIIGTEILQEGQDGKRGLEFSRGPLFAHLLLADEINRTPPKTQSALLEAMQERQVTVGRKTFRLERPFFVLATRNPIEQEGTYPLPEAQTDRFLFSIRIDYPQTVADEVAIVLQTTGAVRPVPQPLLSRDRLLAWQELIRTIPVPESVARYAVELVRKTRPGYTESTDQVNRYVDWGAGPRAAQALVRAAKANAAFHACPTVREEDIQRVLLPVLRHRIVLNYLARADEIDEEQIIGSL